MQATKLKTSRPDMVIFNIATLLEELVPIRYPKFVEICEKRYGYSYMKISNAYDILWDNLIFTHCRICGLIIKNDPTKDYNTCDDCHSLTVERKALDDRISELQQAIDATLDGQGARA